MIPRPMKKDSAHDNTAAGIARRAAYAEQALRLEAQLVAADVGGMMAVCALLGVADSIARKTMPKAAFQEMLIDMLYQLSKSGKS